MKPANVLLDSKNLAKITDFGISKYAFAKRKGKLYSNILPQSFDKDRDEFTVLEDIYAFGLCMLGMIVRPQSIARKENIPFYLASLLNHCAVSIYYKLLLCNLWTN